MKGFTLIELMIVVAMIAILAAIALPAYRAAKDPNYNAQKQARSKAYYQRLDEELNTKCMQGLMFVRGEDDSWVQIREADGTYRTC